MNCGERLGAETMNKKSVLDSLRGQNRTIAAMLRMLKEMQRKNERIIGAINRGEFSIEEGTALPVAETAEQVIGYLNDFANRFFDPGALDTLQLIRDLLEQSWTVEDILLVVDYKCREWDGTNFQQYLRPQTLFGKNFESYLVEAQVHAERQCRPGRRPIEGLKQLHRMKVQQYQNEMKKQQEALNNE